MATLHPGSFEVGMYEVSSRGEVDIVMKALGKGYLIKLGKNCLGWVSNHQPKFNKLPFDLQYKYHLEIQTEGPIIQLLTCYKL